MTGPKPNVINILARENVGRSQTVAERIERRLTVLRTWLAEGIPMGKVVPKSLNSSRLWHDDELAIQPIRSPNEFTTTHVEHGRNVKQIGELLTALARRYSRPKRPLSKPAPIPKSVHAAYDQALARAVSQWHNERDQRLVEQRRANDANTRSVSLLDENAAKDRLIADLRGQLSDKIGLRVAK